jgi:hypothetical protein
MARFVKRRATAFSNRLYQHAPGPEYASHLIRQNSFQFQPINEHKKACGSFVEPHAFYSDIIARS